MRVVVDTNVLVSGMLCPYSPSGEVVRMLSSGDPVPCFDARILTEYREVLPRPKFRLDPAKVSLFLDFIAHHGEVCAGAPLSKPLPDPDDEPFLEVAVAGQVECLLTGNLSHFPADRRAGVRVVTPRQFLELWKSRRTGRSS
ncbi:MAG: putative toxin-antitoxin system toxin component, PIN family [Planctomycetes bacterium]|nr:putative toxin-antitoxin system toxin component, PIN family [Planctomycetota bacterium]